MRRPNGVDFSSATENASIGYRYGYFFRNQVRVPDVAPHDIRRQNALNLGCRYAELWEIYCPIF
jgi:hypothetical protein